MSGRPQDTNTTSGACQLDVRHRGTPRPPPSSPGGQARAVPRAALLSRGEALFLASSMGGKTRAGALSVRLGLLMERRPAPGRARASRFLGGNVPDRESRPTFDQLCNHRIAFSISTPARDGSEPARPNRAANARDSFLTCPRWRARSLSGRGRGKACSRRTLVGRSAPPPPKVRALPCQDTSLRRASPQLHTEPGRGIRVEMLQARDPRKSREAFF